MGEARGLIPKHGFKFREEDVSHDFAKQKELHQTPNAANEYPLFQYHKDKENIYHIGNLEALKTFLTSPPPSLLSLHDSVQEEDIDLLLGDDNQNGKNNQVNDNQVKNEVNEEGKEEEEKEPALGFISQSLQTVEGVVKYSTSWLTSWFYSPPTISPLPSAELNNNHNEQPNNTVNNAVNNNNNDGDSKDDVKEGEKGTEEKVGGGAGNEGEEIKDFKVVQTNWYWRQQNRVLRFDLMNKTMYRYDPLDLSIRAIHPFSLLKDVTCYNSQYFFQLTFYKAENDPTLVYEYYTSSSSDYPLILNLLTTHSSVVPNVLP